MASELVDAHATGTTDDGNVVLALVKDETVLKALRMKPDRARAVSQDLDLMADRAEEDGA